MISTELRVSTLQERMAHQTLWFHRLILVYPFEVAYISYYIMLAYIERILGIPQIGFFSKRIRLQLLLWILEKKNKKTYICHFIDCVVYVLTFANRMSILPYGLSETVWNYKRQRCALLTFNFRCLMWLVGNVKWIEHARIPFCDIHIERTHMKYDVYKHTPTATEKYSIKRKSPWNGVG